MTAEDGAANHPPMHIATLMLLGSGELGREFAIAAKRLGCRIIACDRYANAPAMQLADAFEVVIGDTPRRDYPHVLTADWTFLRLHHGKSGRRGNYSDTELAEWAERLRELRARAEVFAYFNNDWEGFAVRNALALRALL